MEGLEVVSVVDCVGQLCSQLIDALKKREKQIGVLG